MDEFSVRLKQALKDRNMKPSTLSKLTGISKPLISNYLSGKYKAKQDNVYLIAKALIVDEAWLMGYQNVDEFKKDVSDELIKTINNKCVQLTDEQKQKVIDMIDIIK
ncbi:MAG: helix-turn-helix transcriptional regulator [Bacilli bacterium]|nr:helix-turn-helix transcriptional regulator [Bacilli bacterium]